MPEVLNFKKKIIVEMDKAVPSVEWITMKKCYIGQPIRFKIGS